MGESSQWKRYARRGVIEARPWTVFEAIEFEKYNVAPMRTSVSAADTDTAKRQPSVGYVARNPDNPNDQWYIAPDYFAKHYKESK